MVRSAEGSQTAVLVAGYRARATAEGLAGCSDAWASALAGSAGVALTKRWDVVSPQMKLWVALRTRFIDDAVQARLDAGSRQVVILGAGLDTRSVRLRRPDVSFFEVDHPASQQDKRHRLNDVAGYDDAHVAYVACDFERDNFVDRLTDAGFDPKTPAVVVWEGVIYYLPEAAARATLTQVATRLADRSVLVFDILGSNMARRSNKLREEDKAMLEIVEELGEPMQFGVDDAVPLLFECGFRKVRTLSFDELALEYTETYERRRFFRFQSMVMTSVASATWWGA